MRRRISKELAEKDRKLVLSLAHALIQRAPFGRFMAYELVHHHAAALGAITEAEVQSLGKGISSWGEVDTFSCYVAGPAWRAGRIDERTINRWARSDDRWWRRAALVSTVPLNSRTEPAPQGVQQTLALCLVLASDRDDMVVKALSWALRALAKRDPEAARAFLSAQKNTLAPRVIREVQNKLTTGLKTGVSQKVNLR